MRPEILIKQPIKCRGAREGLGTPLTQGVDAVLVYKSVKPQQPTILCPLYANDQCTLGKMRCIQSIPDLRTPESISRTRTEAQEASRFKDVLTLMAIGLTKNQIADKLFISPDTVKSRQSNIYDRYGVNSAEMAVVRGIRNGDIPLDEVASAFDFGLLSQLEGEFEEKKVLDALVASTDSSSNANIAIRTGKQESTVRSYLSDIRRKLDVRNRVALAAYYEIAKTAGLV